MVPHLKQIHWPLHACWVFLETSTTSLQPKCNPAAILSATFGKKSFKYLSIHKTENMASQTSFDKAEKKKPSRYSSVRKLWNRQQEGAQRSNSFSLSKDPSIRDSRRASQPKLCDELRENETEKQMKEMLDIFPDGNGAHVQSRPSAYFQSNIYIIDLETSSPPTISKFDTNSQDSSLSPAETNALEEDGYINMVRQLSMPHLKPVLQTKAGEPANGRGICYDLSTVLHKRPGMLTERVKNRDNCGRINLSQLLPPSGLCSRFLLFSGLSPIVINGLGSTFWMNPEFFEIHLNSSKSSSSLHDNKLPSTQNPHSIKRSLASMRWFRSVKDPAFDSLVDKRQENYFCSILSKFGPRGRLPGLDAYIYPLVNLFRRRIHILVNFDDLYESEDSGSGFLSAWEERITVYFAKENDCPAVGTFSSLR